MPSWDPYAVEIVHLPILTAHNSPCPFSLLLVYRVWSKTQASPSMISSKAGQRVLVCVCAYVCACVRDTFSCVRAPNRCPTAILNHS